jgi:hypothetical protein
MTRIAVRKQAAQIMAALDSVPMDFSGSEGSWGYGGGRDVTTAAMNRASDVRRTLAATSQHRHFRLPDLIIAATAELNGATVLHYETDYDRIAAVTGQPTEWVAERGSL